MKRLSLLAVSLILSTGLLSTASATHSSQSSNVTKCNKALKQMQASKQLAPASSSLIRVENLNNLNAVAIFFAAEEMPVLLSGFSYSSVDSQGYCVFNAQLRYPDGHRSFSANLYINPKKHKAYYLQDGGGYYYFSWLPQ
jgi:hypothetical protein